MHACDVAHILFPSLISNVSGKMIIYNNKE